MAEGIVFGILAAIATMFYYQEAARLAAGNNNETHVKQVYVNNIAGSIATLVAGVFTESSELLFLPRSL